MADASTTAERERRVVELQRESARYVLANDDGFYTRREIWDARQLLAETEPAPEGWAGRLPGFDGQNVLGGPRR